MEQKRIETIFAEALRIQEPGERAAFVEQACAADQQAKAMVESLLVAARGAGTFLETPVSLAVNGEPPPEVGSKIGPYKLLERLGEGAFGEVFVAEQKEPVRRRVALKIVKPGMDTRAVVARFEAERQALAMMDHPNIARIFDAGTTESGRPYFAMELVRGTRITDFCDREQLPMGKRLELFIQVCRAVQHAHQQGIIHRDLKPSNILVTLHDGVPVPKVIDFGLAKAVSHQVLTDKTLYTAFHQFVGTPAYMSPEQAEMSGLGIDTRTDIYALGVLLYEMLTGSPPFESRTLMAAGVEEMRRIIREKEPAVPSTRLSSLSAQDLEQAAHRRHLDAPRLVSLVRGDLDWIVMKALEKDRRRRYESAAGLAQEVERHLRHEPVLARPPSTIYRLQKYVRRHKVLVTAGSVVFLTLVVGSIASAHFGIQEHRQRKQAEQSKLESQQLAIEARELAIREREQRERAEKSEREALESAYISDMNVSFHALRENQLERVRELLERHRPKPGQKDLRSWEWGYLWRQLKSDEYFSLPAHQVIRCVAFSPSGKLLAAGGRDKTVVVWDVASRSEIATLDHPHSVADAVFSLDETCLVTGTKGEEDSTLHYWEVGAWRERKRITNQWLVSLALASDGKTLAVTDASGQVVLRDFATAEPLQTLAQSPNEHRVLRTVSALRKPILAVDATNGVALWNVEKRRKLRTIPFEPGELALKRVARLSIPAPLALSPDGTRLAVGGKFIEVLQLNRDDRRTVLTNLASEVWTMAFSPDGGKLAAADADSRILIWDTAEWTRLAELKGHRAPAVDLAFSPDGNLLASGGSDGAIRFWHTSEFGEKQVWHSFSTNTMVFWQASGGVRCSPEDTSLNIRLENKVIETRLPTAPVGEVYMSPKGRFVCFAGQDGIYRIWDVEAEKEVCTLAQKESYDLPPRCFSPDETLILGVEKATGARVVWRTADGRETARLETGGFAPLPFEWWGAHSRTVMIADGRNRGLHLWDIKSVVRQILPHEGSLSNAIMSRDAKHIATLDSEGIVKLWDWDGQAYQESHSIGDRRPLAFHYFLCPMDFTPDGRRLAVTAGVRELTIYDVATGQVVGSPLLDQPPAGCAFSEDGNSLIVSMIEAFTRLQATPFAEANR